VEAMLIDWQGGFLGSLCNDLMWCVFPFLEVNSHDADMYEFAIKHYYDELKNVLETFNCTLEDYGFPDTVAEFRSLIRRGFVLEFLIVTSLRPVLNITRPEEISKWWQKLQKYEKAQEAGGLRKLLHRKRPKLPSQESVFQNPRYLEFLQFYFKIATSLGAFQELGLIYFELMKDSMFGESKIQGFEDDLKEPVKAKIFSKSWFKSLLRKKKKADDEEVAKIETGDNVRVPDMSKIDEVQPGRAASEGAYEPISFSSDNKTTAAEEVAVVKEEAEVEEPVVEEASPERSPSPPDPLRSLAAELHGKFALYKDSYKNFSTGMNEFHEEIEGEMREQEEREAMNQEEELEVVRKMSQEDAWSHVVSGVMREKKLSTQSSVEEPKKEKDELEAWQAEEAANQAAMEKMARDMELMEQEMSGSNQISLEQQTENEVNPLTMPERMESGNENNLNIGPDSAQQLLVSDELESPKIVASLAKSQKEEETSIILKDDIQPSPSSELQKTLQQISKDIDLSNDKVLETIAFLETPTPNEDTLNEEAEVMNKKERERRDLEMLLDEDEGMFHEKEEGGGVQEECTKDSIIAWLGQSVVDADDDSEFVYVSPWADEDDKEEEDTDEQKDSVKDACSGQSSYENLHETPTEDFARSYDGHSGSSAPCSPNDSNALAGNCSIVQLSSEKLTNDSTEEVKVEKSDEGGTVQNDESVTEGVLDGSSGLSRSQDSPECEAAEQVEKEDESGSSCSCESEMSQPSDGDNVDVNEEVLQQLEEDRERDDHDSLQNSEEVNDEDASEDIEEDDEEAMLMAMMEELKAAEEAQEAAEAERIKTERHAQIAKDMAERERERLRAEKKAEMENARKEEVIEEKEKTLESIQEKREMLAKLKEQLAEQKNIITQAKQEMKEAQEMEETQAIAEAGENVDNVESVNAEGSRPEEIEEGNDAIVDGQKEEKEGPQSENIAEKSEDAEQVKVLEALKEKTVLLSQLKGELEVEKRNASLIKEEMKSEELVEERAAAELARKKAEKEADVAQIKANAARAKAEKEAELRSAQKVNEEARAEKEKALEAIKEKRLLLAKLKEDLAEEQERVSNAKREMEDISEEQAEEETKLELDKQTRENAEQEIMLKALKEVELQEEQTKIKCRLEDEKNKVVEAKREMEEQRKQAEEEAHKKLDEHEELKREKARLEKKLEEDKIKIAIARKAMEEAKQRAEEEAKAKVAEEAKLKDVEESIEKLHAEVRQELSLSARDHQKRLKEGGAGLPTEVEKEEIPEEKDENIGEAEEVPLSPGPPISSYAAVASCQQPINNESNVDPPPPPSEMDPLNKTTLPLPLVVVVDEKEVCRMDGIDSEGFTEVATRRSKRGKKEGNQSNPEINEEEPINGNVKSYDPSEFIQEEENASADIDEPLTKSVEEVSLDEVMKRKALEAIQEKETILANLKSKLAAEKAGVSLAKQEMEDISKEQQESDAQLLEEKQKREQVEEELRLKSSQMAQLHERQEGIMKKLEENVNIMESTKNAVESSFKTQDDSETGQKVETPVAAEKSVCSDNASLKATAENGHSDLSSAPKVMALLKEETELRTDLSQTSNFPNITEMESSSQEDPTPTQHDRETTHPDNTVKTKEAARRNILKYVGKMKAKEDAEQKEEGGGMEKKTNGKEPGLQVNGIGHPVTMQKEAKEEKSLSPVENDSQEEELRPNGQEVIEKSNGSYELGKLQDGAEKVAVKMRVQKCKESNDDKGTSEGSTLDDQNLSSALKRLAPTGTTQETEEEEEENRQAQCGGFESTSSRDDRLQRGTSAVSSGNNTLKRNWRKSSKKKRKSTHIL